MSFLSFLRRLFKKAEISETEQKCPECGKPVIKPKYGYAAKVKKFCSIKCYRRHYYRNYLKRKR